MGKPNFRDEFKRVAVVQITDRGYPVAEVWLRRPSVRSVWALARIRCMFGSDSSRRWCRAMLARTPRSGI